MRGLLPLKTSFASMCANSRPVNHSIFLFLLFLCVAQPVLEASAAAEGCPLCLNGSAIPQSAPAHPSKKGGHMQLTSSSFQPEGNIPRQFTCEGNDISPELSWKNAPSGVKTFALIVHDPDAHRAGGFTHWVVYNI